MYCNGQGKRPLVNTTMVASNGTLPTSLSFGTYLVSDMAGITGMVKCDSAFGASVQFEYLQNSGAAPIVTSAVAITSGTLISEMVPGAFCNIGVTGIASNSQVRIYLAGIPIR